MRDGKLWAMGELTRRQRNRAICGATRADGATCRMSAGAGTDHRGRGRCHKHGGATPSAQFNEYRYEAHEQFGAWADIDPAEAIMLCIRVAAGEVYWFNDAVDRLALDEIVVTPVSKTTGRGPEGPVDMATRSNDAKLNLLIRARQEATDRLFRYSKDALQLGLDERRVRAAEQWGQLMGQLLSRVLDDLELTPAQAELAPTVVRTRLLELEAAA